MHRRSFGLDFFRATAIIAVVISHFAQALEILGLVGVELFFVLSGFLIGGIYWRKLSSTPNFGWRDLLEFLKRRWIRTLPNYLLFLGLNIIWLPIFRHYPVSKLPSLFLPYFFFLQNFAWPIPGAFELSWSLAIEEWFYLLFPALVLIFALLTKRKHSAFLFVIGAMMLVPFLLRLTHDATHWDRFIRRVVIYRLDALMFGVALAYIKSEKVALWEKLNGGFIPGLVIVLLTLGLLHKVGENAPSWQIAVAFTLLPLGCALLLPLVEHMKAPKSFLAQWITNISLWSYSIYLSHTMIMFTFNYFTDPLNLGFVGKLAVKVVALAVCFVLSSLLYRYFELPMMNRRKPDNTALQVA